MDYHTAGEPFRIVVRGAPELHGDSVLARRRHAAAEADDVRRLLVNEPRGHADMYGCFVVPPDDEGADLGVVFFHNEGYSTACGHGTIALVTWAIDERLVPVVEPETRVTVDAPSGRLAILDADGELPRGETLTHLSIVGTAFEGRVVGETGEGVVCEVAGSASLTGRHEFVLEPDDELGEGFLLR